MNVAALSQALANVGTGNQTLPKDLEGACRGLEQEFAAIVFRKMHEAMVPKSGAGGSSGFARQTAESMLDDQWAALSSQGEGLGLWRALYRQLEPLAVKSKAGSADENTTEEAHRKEAERHDDAKGSSRTPGQRMGNPQARRAEASYPGVPGLSGSASARLPGDGLAERKGK